MSDECGVKYERHPTQTHLIAICARPMGHDGEHSNVLHKPGQGSTPREDVTHTHLTVGPSRGCPACEQVAQTLPGGESR